jgi:Dolichyl-phosphate-mannose-protein mannosyltransferase
VWLTPTRARWLALALLPPAILAWAGTVAHKTLNPDESQHLHAAWLVATGAVPFADFWEHHMPLLYYLLAPLTLWFAESPAVYLAGRAVMAVAALTALVFVSRLAARLSPVTGLAAVALVAFLPRVVEHATEVRPDVPALAAWLGGLVALVRWRETGGTAWLWRAGILFGVGASFTPKIGYSAAGVLAVLAVGAWERGPGRAGRLAMAIGRVAAGAFLPPLLLLGGLWLHGGRAAVDGLAEGVVGVALRFGDFAKEGPVTDEGLGFVALALAGLGLVGREHGRALLRHPVHGTVVPPLVATVAVLLLPWTPAVYRHAWMPVLALAGVYAGHALVTLGSRSRVLAVIAVVVGLVGPASVSLQKAMVDGNTAQFRVMRQQLARACPGEPVLDGTALYVFRPAAYRYRVLISAVRDWIARGMLGEERIVEDVVAARPRVAYIDQRLRGLIGPMADFLAIHFVRSADGVLVAGAAIRVEPPRDGGRGQVDLIFGETYRLTVQPGGTGVEVTIDGQPARPGLVRLAEGRHEVAWRGPVTSIELVTLPCAERRQRGEAAADGLSGSGRRATVNQRLGPRAILAPTPTA